MFNIFFSLAGFGMTRTHHLGFTYYYRPHTVCYGQGSWARAWWCGSPYFPRKTLCSRYERRYWSSSNYWCDEVLDRPIPEQSCHPYLYHICVAAAKMSSQGSQLHLRCHAPSPMCYIAPEVYQSRPYLCCRELVLSISTRERVQSTSSGADRQSWRSPGQRWAMRNYGEPFFYLFLHDKSRVNSQ